MLLTKTSQQQNQNREKPINYWNPIRLPWVYTLPGQSVGKGVAPTG